MSSRDAERALIDRLVRLRSGQTVETGSLYLAKNELFARHLGPLRHYCGSIVGTAARGDELAQDVMNVAWRRLESYRGDTGSFRAWLYGIARFTCLNANTKKKDVLVEDGVFDPQDPEPDQWQRLHREERLRILLDVVQGLSPQQQDALYLRYYEEMPVGRITEELGILQKSGARGVLQSCKRHLRTALEVRMGDQQLGSSFFAARSKG